MADITLTDLAALEAAIKAEIKLCIVGTHEAQPKFISTWAADNAALHELNLMHVADHRAALEASTSFESNGISREECHACELATFEESKRDHTRRLMEHYGVKHG